MKTKMFIKRLINNEILFTDMDWACFAGWQTYSGEQVELKSVVREGTRSIYELCSVLAREFVIRGVVSRKEIVIKTPLLPL